MSDTFTLSFRPEIVFTDETDRLTLQFATHSLTLDRPQPGLRSALEHLKHSALTTAQLTALVVEADGVEDSSNFEAELQKLINLGWICHSVLPLATAVAITTDYQLISPVFDWDKNFNLSRFAFLRQENQQFVLESPLSKAKIILLDWRAAALIGKLAQSDSSLTLENLADSLINVEIVQSLIKLLIATKMISLEPESEALAEWQFHNLLFHRQTRLKRLDDARKSQIPSFEDSERAHFVKSPMSDEVIFLEKPHLEALAKTDISLTQAIESRQSIREYDNQPITLKQLGEFLYRCARVKEVYTREEDIMNIGELTKRPYPAGGALYELEIYPVINQCQGLDSGLYHYQPLSHALYAIADGNSTVEALIFDAWKSTGQQNVPQVLLIVTARFGRLFWKYYAIGYGLILKHIGVLFQTFYLVATAMQLAPSAIGAGNSEQFVKIANLNEYEESSVGEFILGSLKQ
ncbi:SagB family peptide dehydrogenase [Plectonema cf. radiosum LEGE 06105]|uniref:SagB family peptide dehydrogenase n=1 Tax=Plectonema cf. radiosum LEGE 06105 TaxID=945769 RepID=A0A8J7K2W2_9CYAN|nr:SagB family peptide dehydrogenase [Plectonema radiosum]MBE9213357.1 SagB family peptide dehydrogenase [Plectonema cf. radiosum LEGE 06105]